MSSRLHEPIRGSGEVDQQVVSTSQKIENDGCRQIDNIREAHILTIKSKEIDSEIVKTKKENLNTLSIGKHWLCDFSCPERTVGN